MPSEKARSLWDSLKGSLGVVVGVLALSVTVYTAFLQRKQAHASVWPHVVAYSGSPEFHFTIANKGVGPAIVKYVELRVDGHPMSTWDETFSALLGEKQGTHYDWYRWSSIGSAVLVPGESLEVLSIHDAARADAIRDAWGRVSGTVCYCSIFDDCWIFDDGASDRSIDACPVRGASTFKQ